MKLLSLLYNSQVYFFSHGSKMFLPLKLEGVTFVAGCVKCVPIPVIKEDDPRTWVVENCSTQPLPTTQNLMTHPLSDLAQLHTF